MGWEGGGIAEQENSSCRLRSSAFAPNDFSACVLSASVVFSPATPGLQPTGLLCPWDSPAKSTGGGCHFPPGDLPDPGIEPLSRPSPALTGGFFTTGTTWEAPFLLNNF